MTLPVSEVYGPVFQGEGPAAGRRCHFVRLGLCNLSCTWCDTPYTWDDTRFDVHAECPPLTTDQILDALPPIRTGLLVISGGEPLIHQRNNSFTDLLRLWTGPVHIETNGTLPPADFTREHVEQFIVSPKLAHSGDTEKKRLNPVALAAFTLLAHSGHASFKFVCRTPDDVQEASLLVAAYGIPRHAVWIMPEGISASAVITHAMSIEAATHSAGFNLTLRQHVLLHGDERLQ